jgi:hypothetical protein
MWQSRPDAVRITIIAESMSPTFATAGSTRQLPAA